jgi:hypothetical protein
MCSADVSCIGSGEVGVTADTSDPAMDTEIRQIITRVYVEQKDNLSADVEVAYRMKADLASVLSKISGLSVDIQLSPDPEYKRIEYGENCGVMLDIVLSVPNNKYAMVVQISKLGRYACFYWRRDRWLGARTFKYRVPRGWPENIVIQIRKEIEDCGIRFLGNKELEEEFEGIREYFASHDEEYATVRGLLFCFDGAH